MLENIASISRIFFTYNYIIITKNIWTLNIHIESYQVYLTTLWSVYKHMLEWSISF